jgi:hypothetical protein
VECREDLLKSIPAGTHVERAQALDAAKHLSIKGKYPGWLALPDRWASWWPGAVATGMKIIREQKPDVIWSTYPIATAHLIGASLAERSDMAGRAEEGLPAHNGDIFGNVPDQVEMMEGDRRYLVPLKAGLKTGFYLDQRDNRALLRDLVEGREVPWRGELFLESLFTMRDNPFQEGIRTQRWKYIRFYDGKMSFKEADVDFKDRTPDFEMLFDLEADPTEHTNLAADATHAAILAELRQKTAAQSIALGAALVAGLATASDYRNFSIGSGFTPDPQTGTGTKDYYSSFFEMSYRAKWNVWLSDLGHCDCGLNPDADSGLFQKVLKGQGVHNGSKHSHVVSSGALHAALG